MARELLVKEPPLHLERFDWESFFYVLCWIGTHYLKGAKIDTTAFRNWDTDDDSTLRDLKLLLLQGPSSTLFPLFSGFYQPMLVDWIIPIQRMYGAVGQKEFEHELAKRMSPRADVPEIDTETLGGCVTWEKLWQIFQK